LVGELCVAGEERERRQLGKGLEEGIRSDMCITWKKSFKPEMRLQSNEPKYMLNGCLKYRRKEGLIPQVDRKGVRYASIPGGGELSQKKQGGKDR